MYRVTALDVHAVHSGRGVRVYGCFCGVGYKNGGVAFGAFYSPGAIVIAVTGCKDE
jgi:hypothetical protein